MHHFFRSGARRVMLLMLVMIGIHSITLAQSIPVSGRVVNEKNEPIANMSVTVKGTTNGVTTGDNGTFALTVPSRQSTLVFSAIGYTTQEVTVGNQSTINLTMKAGEAGQLDAVVVVGYGTAKKATVTGAVSSVKGDVVKESPALNVSNNLVGRLPGLVAVQGSGEPGYDGSAIRIRGANTLNNNDVLVVVDGIQGRSLDRIDPNTIESVTILKDASAAIYGSQAANGVILITTKRGKLGKPSISLSLNYGANQPTVIPKMTDAATYSRMLDEITYYRSVPASEWTASSYEQFINGGYTTAGGSTVTPRYSLEDIQKYKDGSAPWTHPNTDWFGATLREWSPLNQTNLTVSGGTEAMRYFVSIGSQFQDGNYFNSATRFKQYNFRSNLDGRITKDISIAVDVAGRQEDRKFPTRSAGDIFWMVMRGKPNLPAYWPDGTPGPDIEYGNNPVVISTDATGYDREKYYVLNSNMKLTINIPWIKGLSFVGNAAVDKGIGFRKQWYTPWYLYTWDYQTYDADGKPVLERGKRGFDDPRLRQSMRDETRTQLNGYFNYETKIAGDHGIKVTAGAESIKGNGDNFTAFRRFFPSAAIDQLFAGGRAEMSNGGSGYVNARQNLFGRVNYSFRDKYLAEFVWRYDGSYIFPESKRFGFFPGVSAGWRISEENFFKNSVPFVNNLKLRGSYGKTGNDRIPEWQYLATYAYGNYWGFGNFPFVTMGGAENVTLYETRVPNPNATWEIANQADIGVDIGLLKNKLTIEADYFNYRRSQILIKPSASIPTTAGFEPPYQNIGRVANRGFDFSVNYRDNVGKFSYSVGVNGGYAKNKILFWDETPGAPNYQLSTGHPMNTGLFYVSEGVFVDQAAVDKVPHWSGAAPGDLIFKDVDGNGTIDANDRIRIDKSSLPTFTGGLTMNLNYGGFDLSILFQGATGGVSYIQYDAGEIGNYLQDFAENRWTPANPSSVHPRAYNRNNEYFRSQANTYWLRKTDYLRLKTLQFGYNLPTTVNSKLGFQNARVFVSGFNLFTWAPDFKNFDPESAYNGGVATVSGTNYPLQRMVNAGISVTF